MNAEERRRYRDGIAQELKEWEPDADPEARWGPLTRRPVKWFDALATLGARDRGHTPMCCLAARSTTHRAMRGLIATSVGCAALLAACAHTQLVGPLPSYSGLDAGTLYIARPPGGLGALGGIHVVLDGRKLGEIGVGEYWRLRVKPGLHNVATYAASTGMRVRAGGTSCVVIGVWAEGVYVRPADHCPPPKSWKMAAESRARRR